MNSVADMGGMDGLGPLVIEKDEPIFHADWEKRTIGVHLACAFAGAWISEDCRHAMERMPAASYLATSYYEHWLFFIETLLVEKGYATVEELATGYVVAPLEPAKALSKVPPGGNAVRIFRGGGVLAMDSDRQARFTAGHKVRARNMHPHGHTRLPRYVRGHVGTIVKHLGSFIYSDTRAHGLGDEPQPVYCVRFEGRELWGPDCDANSTVVLDLYDDYLEPVE